MVSLAEHRVLGLLGDLTREQGVPIAIALEGAPGHYMLYSNADPNTNTIHDRMLPLLSKPTDIRGIITWLNSTIKMVKLRNGSVINDDVVDMVGALNVK